MAIKNTIFGGTDWGVIGLNNTDLNDTFDAMVQLLGKDVGSDTWISVNTSYTEIATINVSSTSNSTVLVMITVDITGEGGSIDSYPSVELKIGEAASEAQVKEWTGALGLGGIVTYATMPKTLFYLHTLTAGEKSNGFNIIVNGKYATGGTGGLTSTHHQTIAIGTN